MTDLSFDFAESLVVGLGVGREEKALLARKWAEFSTNACTFMARFSSACRTLKHQPSHACTVLCKLHDSCTHAPTYAPVCRD